MAKTRFYIVSDHEFNLGHLQPAPQEARNAGTESSDQKYYTECDTYCSQYF